MNVLLTLSLLGGWFFPAQAQQPVDPAVRLLESMPAAARVGQLFIVSFPGISVDETTDIWELLIEYRIGGVLLRSANDNIVNEGDTATQVATLTNALQNVAWEAARTPLPSEMGSDEEGASSPFVPLLIAVEQEGDIRVSTGLVNGATPLPSSMAVGATWDATAAETVGTIVGSELSAMGVNMLLGPSLDVLDTPRPGSSADLGTRSFGGDPYWVGRMGTAYVRGVHNGSDGRIAVVPGRFPGLGAADRPLSEEVSTVQKSLEQLKQIELAPFFAVAGTEDPLSSADGLLISHIRYRGFQGNIYQSTKPVSFDPQALQQLMALPELAGWRAAGGVTVADDLGVRAVRRFYDPTEREFNALRIAQEAFLAGNDLMILSHFAQGDDWESHMANVRATLAFFRGRYASDPTFQARVDEAVLRILRLKLGLYTTFSQGTVQVDVETVGQQLSLYGEQVAPIAQNAVTLLSPPSPDLRPAAPSTDESIVIFSDDRRVADCASCAPEYVIPPTLLMDTLVRLYGPTGTRQVSPARISSFTFSQLIDYLNIPPTTGATVPEGGTPPASLSVEMALQEADWVIFAMLDITDQVPPSLAVRRFLAERGDLLRGKQVVVLAFGAPYYLDTTEIAKLSIYFGLYSHGELFVEAAARALFDEFPFVGDSPVSVTGINYNLTVRTQPEPGQVIEVFYEITRGEVEEGVGLTPSPTVQATPQSIEINQGDTLNLRTSVIVDRNGHPVPDGTPVDFIFTYPQEGLEHSRQVTTIGGVAETEIKLDRVGRLDISVRAEPVPRAVRLEMDIREGQPAVIIAITPTPTPTPLPSPTPTIAPTQPVTPTLSPDMASVKETGGGPMSGADLGLGLLGTLLVAAAGFVGHWLYWRNLSRALRVALWGMVGGLVVYIALALGLPGIDWMRQQAGAWAAGVLAGAGAALLLAVVLLRSSLRDESTMVR